MYPIIIHVPHCSVLIPGNLRKYFVINDEELRNELLIMTDWYTDKIFSYPGVESQKSMVSRLVFDPERFRDDQKEIMAQKGMGAVYTKTSGGRPLISLTQEYKRYILQEYYDAYHDNFNNRVDQILQTYGKCLILDGHSFSSRPLLHEPVQDAERPDFCIGTDDIFTPTCLVKMTVNLFEAFNMRYSINNPYSGTFVTNRHYLAKDTRVKSIMIEVNRALYMNERTNEKRHNFENIQCIINELISKYIQAF